MKIVIVGAGAIGGYLGARLARANAADVVLFARGPHLKAMQERGLRVISPDGDFEVKPAVTGELGELGTADVVFLGVKAHSLTALAPSLLPLIGPDTVVVSTQNGIPWWYFQVGGGEFEGLHLESVDPGGVIGRAIDLDFARQELAATANPRANEAGVDDIQRVVCHHFKLRTSELLSKDRHKSIAFARHVAMYLCKQRLKCSFPELGRAFGNRDHTTVMSAVRKVEHLRSTDPEVRAHLEAIERMLGTND